MSVRYQYVTGEGFVSDILKERLMKIIKKQLPTAGLCNHQKKLVGQAQEERLERWIKVLSHLPEDQQEQQINQWNETATA